jgi:DNA-binding MarR family transcriptional regulator
MVREVSMSRERLSQQDYESAAEVRLALRTFVAQSEPIITKHGLTPKRYELLLLVKVSAPKDATVTNLAERLAIGQSAATQLVRRAENDDLLERRLSRVDARIHHLQLTITGERRLEAALKELGPQRADLIQVLTSLAGR